MTVSNAYAQAKVAHGLCARANRFCDLTTSKLCQQNISHVLFLLPARKSDIIIHIQLIITYILAIKYELKSNISCVMQLYTIYRGISNSFFYFQQNVGIDTCSKMMCQFYSVQHMCLYNTLWCICSKVWRLFYNWCCKYQLVRCLCYSVFCKRGVV